MGLVGILIENRVDPSVQRTLPVPPLLVLLELVPLGVTNHFFPIEVPVHFVAGDV